jgi:RimJ/RimL family protein N-acetyltransferase
MYEFFGRFVYLKQLTTKNENELFELIKNNEEEYRKYVSDQPIPENYDEFVKTVDIWFESGRNCQFLVYKKQNKKLIGTIFFYGWNEKDQIKISAFFVKEVRKSPLVGEALGAAFLFAKQIMKIKELNFDCYIENKEMINLAKKIGAIEIEKRKSNVNPERELISFSVSEEKITELIKKFKSFEQRQEKNKEYKIK